MRYYGHINVIKIPPDNHDEGDVDEDEDDEDEDETHKVPLPPPSLHTLLHFHCHTRCCYHLTHTHPSTLKDNTHDDEGDDGEDEDDSDEDETDRVPQ